MDLKEIQKRIDAMPAAMAAKGKRKANAAFEIKAHDGGWIGLTWERSDKNEYLDGFEYIRFDNHAYIPAALDEADAWIKALPSIEKAQMAEFMAALAGVVEKGKAFGIDADIVNPLVVMMKDLSKNALTDQRAA